MNTNGILGKLSNGLPGVLMTVIYGKDGDLERTTMRISDESDLTAILEIRSIYFRWFQGCDGEQNLICLAWNCGGTKTDSIRVAAISKILKGLFPKHGVCQGHNIPELLIGFVS